MDKDSKFTRDEEGYVAVRVVNETEDLTAVTDKDYVFARDKNGNIAIRVVNGAGGNGHFLGGFATPQALAEAYPIAEPGDFAIVESTDTVWVWDNDEGQWIDSDRKGQVTSVNGQTGAVTVQETLVNQSNIKSVNGNSLLGSGNLELTASLAFPSSWTTNSTTKAFCDDVAADSSAVVGKMYIGEVTFSDLPESISNSEVEVKIMDGSTAQTKVIILELTSGNVAPYKWQYTYWNGGSNVSGWIGFLPTTGGTLNGNLTLTSSARIALYGGGEIYGAKQLLGTGHDAFLSKLRVINYDNAQALAWGAISEASMTANLGQPAKAWNTIYAAFLHANGNATGKITIPDPQVDSTLAITVTTMPSAASNNAGQLYHYIGATDSTYTSGYFYKCVQNGSSYEYQRIDVQPSGVTSVNGNTGAVTISAADLGAATMTIPATMPTLAVADWSSNTQTVSVTGVTATNTVLVAPAPASAADYAAAGIVCTAQAADSLTFTCDTVPSNAITVNVVIMG